MESLVTWGGEGLTGDDNNGKVLFIFFFFLFKDSNGGEGGEGGELGGEGRDSPCSHVILT